MRFKFPRTLKEWQKKGEHFFHMVYLAAVGLEAHGFYALSAQVLFCVTVAGVFLEREAEEGE